MSPIHGLTGGQRFGNVALGFLDEQERLSLVHACLWPAHSHLANDKTGMRRHNQGLKPVAMENWRDGVHQHLRLCRVQLSFPRTYRDTGGELATGIYCVCPTAGVGRHATRSTAQDIRAGDVLVGSTASDRMVTAQRDSPMVFWAFSVLVGHLFPLLIPNELSLLQRLTDGLRVPKVYPAGSPLAERCHELLREGSTLPELDQRGQLLRVITTILNVEFAGARLDGGSRRAEACMRDALERLTVAEILSTSVGQLSQRLGCSRRQLSRLFQQHFGVSVAALRMEMRLLNALNLLRNRDLKVINVAEQCGFNHLGLFNACFKRRFGCNPSRWRKSLGADEDEASLAEPEPDCRMRIHGLCPWWSKA